MNGSNPTPHWHTDEFELDDPHDVLPRERGSGRSARSPEDEPHHAVLGFNRTVWAIVTVVAVMLGGVMTVQWLTRSSTTAQETSLSGLEIEVPRTEPSSPAASPDSTASPRATPDPSATPSRAPASGTAGTGQQPTDKQQDDAAGGPATGDQDGTEPDPAAGDGDSADKGDSGSDSGGDGSAANPEPSADEPDEETPEQDPEPDVADPDVNLAVNASVSASSQAQGSLPVSNILDAALGTYWEAGPGFPQTVTIDLGRVTTVGRAVLSVPTGWSQQRTQTVTVLGSIDGTSYSPLKGSAAYQFRNSSNNQAAASFTPTPVRYVQLKFTGASWGAAQLGDLAVHSS